MNFPSLVRSSVAIALFFGFARQCNSEILFDKCTSVYWAMESGNTVFVTLASATPSQSPEEIMVCGMRDRMRNLVRFKRIPEPIWRGSDDAVLYYTDTPNNVQEDKFRYVIFPKGEMHPDCLWLDDDAGGRSRRTLFRKAISSASCHPNPEEEYRQTMNESGVSSPGLPKPGNPLSVGEGNMTCDESEQESETDSLFDKILNTIGETTQERLLVSIVILAGGWFLISLFGAPWILRTLWIFCFSLVLAGVASSVMHYVCSALDWSVLVHLILGLVHLVLPFVVFFYTFKWSYANWRVFFPDERPPEPDIPRTPRRIGPSAPSGWRDWDPFG